MRNSAWRDAALLAVLIAVVAVARTWPFFADPAHTVAAPIPDLLLSIWVMAWDAHALVTDPLHLFHANAFHPAPYALARAEHLLGFAPLFAPVYWATGNPVLANQLTTLATFVVAGLAMAAWARYWTANRGVAAAAAFLWAFAPFRLRQFAMLHFTSVHLLPLVALGIDATLDRRGRWAPALLAVALVGASFCSYYTAYAAFALLAAYGAAGVVSRGRTAAARLPALGAAAAIAAAAVLAISLPYLRLQHSGQVADYNSASSNGLVLVKLLGAGGIAWRMVGGLEVGGQQFLTWTALALALAALVLWRGLPRAALLATFVAGFVLCLGPESAGGRTLPYRWLMDFVPGFSIMRVPLRFSAVATFAVMGLAVLGLEALRRRCAARGWSWLARLLPVAAAVAVLVESPPQTYPMAPLAVGDAVPAQYRWLAEHGEGGALLELPFGGKLDFVGRAMSMYHSTYHWLPLVDGYTSYPPPSLLAIWNAAPRLPDLEALKTILDVARPRWLLLQLNHLPRSAGAQWFAALIRVARPVKQFPNAMLFEVPTDGTVTSMPPAAAFGPQHPAGGHD